MDALVSDADLLKPEAPRLAARAAGLRYASDSMPGITRLRAGKGFHYRAPDARRIRDAETLRRIASLAVPPAWRAVWIAPDPSAHLQATGRDERGRKQYRYHPRWRQVRDETKFAHLKSFGVALPRLRRRVAHDLARPGLPREKVLAAVVRLMERTLARVGNPEYARENQSFGLTTLRNRHVQVTGGRIELDFRAKSGLRHHSVVADAKLAHILRACRDLPGSELFQYRGEDGSLHSVHSEDVNDYLRAISGREITAKDFRTWAGTNLALLAIRALDGQRPTQRRVAEIVRQVAAQLGNTPAVCRKCYIHPGLMAAWQAGALGPIAAPQGKLRRHVWAVEDALLEFLAHWEPERPSRAKTLAALKARLDAAAAPARRCLRARTSGSRAPLRPRRQHRRQA